MDRVIQELKKSPWNSPLQLGFGGIMIFMIAFFAGPYFGCGGAQNVDYARGAFACTVGTTSVASKVLVVLCVVFCSLCWGRAVSLVEQRVTSERK